MRYTQLTNPQVGEMLTAVGVRTVEELFSRVPEEIRLRRPLAIPQGVSELEVLRDAAALARKTRDCTEVTSFLGGGSYDHFIPTLVDALALQSEFLTAYTPYQAEASQGVLQAFFEFQTMICQLTGMEAANASLYEGATAAAEAAIMAMNITSRGRVLVADNVHPDTLTVLESYGRSRGFAVDRVGVREGVLDVSGIKAALNGETAAVVLQSPNFYGCIERVDQLASVIQDAGALVVQAVDPISLGLLRPPGELGVDIVVGEGQALGIPMSYGGPYLGLLACRGDYLRKMAGRIVGMTKDRNGRRAFCLALQTREQHIRREKATSNICTNQGLLAMRASVYMAMMGKQGVKTLAKQCFDKAHYAAERIASLSGFELQFKAPFFKEFAVRTMKSVAAVMKACRAKGILAGVPLGRFNPAMKDSFLVAVTEKRTKAEIDALVEALAEA